MKNYLLTACGIALGGLALFAPNASASGATREIPVTFDGVAISLCDLSLATALPGTLISSADGSELSSTNGIGQAGTVTVICNTSHSVTVGTPTQVILSTEEDITGNATYTASISDSAGVVGLVSDALTFAGLGNSIVNVDMSAAKTDGTPFQAGVYQFEVPVTIVSN